VQFRIARLFFAQFKSIPCSNYHNSTSPYFTIFAIKNQNYIMNPNIQRPYTFDRVVRMVLSTLVIIGILFTINQLKSVLTPFFIALFASYFLNPMVVFIQEKLKVKHRGLSVIITVILVMIILAIGTAFLVPAFVKEMNKMASLIKIYMSNTDYHDILPAHIETIIRTYIKEANVADYFNIQNITSALKKILPGFWNIFSGSMQLLLGAMSLLIIVLYTVFILTDFEGLKNTASDLIPERYHIYTTEVIKDLSEAMNLYFRSQGLIALIVGILLAIGFSIIGLPMPIIMGLFIGALNIVPYLQIAGIVPALLLALLKAMETQGSFWQMALLVIIVLAVVQLIQEIVLIPKILGKAYGLSPAFVLLALSIWGSLMGLIGMLLALPLTTLIISYYKRFILKTTRDDDNSLA